MYDRISMIEIHINVLEGHGTLIASSANGSLLAERLLSVEKVARLKRALDGICDLGRAIENDREWGLDVSRPL